MFAAATHRVRYYAVSPTVAGSGGGLPTGRALEDDYGYLNITVSRVTVLEEGRFTETVGRILAPLRDGIVQGMAVRVNPTLAPTDETWWMIDGVIPLYQRNMFTLHLNQRGWDNTDIED